MSEREFKPENQEDPRKKHDISVSNAAIGSAGIGGFFGGISYGVSRLTLNEDLANRIGLGVGIGLAGMTAGATFSIRSHEEALQHAIKGEISKTKLKTLQSGLEAGIGYGSTGFISGFEAKGLTGGIIGGIAGAVVGFGGMYEFGKNTQDLGYAYKHLIIPTNEPANFPEHKITRDPRFNEKEVNSYAPPIYQAPSIGSMKEFRQAQLEKIYSEAKGLKGLYKNPNALITHIDQGVFIIPDVNHYPALDPEKDKFLFDKLEEPSDRVQLNTADDSLIAKPYKELSRVVWPYTTEFEPLGMFSDEQWKYWRELSWKKAAVVLAKRTVNYEKVKEKEKFPVDEKYFLIDIMLEPPERGIKKRKKIKNIAGELAPGWNPNTL